MVARSTTGNFLVEPIVAEVLASFHVIEVCKETNFNDIIFEGDVVKKTSNN